MISRWFASIRVFLVWLIGLALVVIILALFHSLFIVFLTNTLRWGRYSIRFFHLLYYALAGLVCVAYFIFVMEYFTRSEKKRKLFQNSLQLIGIQLLLVGGIQTGLVAYGYFRVDWINMLLIILEGFSGGCMLFVANLKKKQSPALKA